MKLAVAMAVGAVIAAAVFLFYNDSRLLTAFSAGATTTGILYGAAWYTGRRNGGG